MKTFICKGTIKLLTAAAMLLTGQAQSSSYVFVAQDNRIETKLCIAAGSNNRVALRQKVRQISPPHLSQFRARGTKWVSHSILCNNKPIAEFAWQYGATDTLKILDKSLYGKYLEAHPQVTIKDVTVKVDNWKEKELVHVGGH